MSTEPEEVVLVSALEHQSYCPRQCYLIHVEGVFDENTFTLRGHRAHERVDRHMNRTERGVIILRALPIWSERYGLTGRCDVVEREGGLFRPVEYKVGARKGQIHASIQAAAQALCLEEMFQTTVLEVALYFAQTKEKVRLPFTEELRTRTLECIEETRRSLHDERPPEPLADHRCRSCSLIDACQPFAVRRSAGLRYDDLFTPSKEGALP